MTIKEDLETILGARYGRDVRQAIHDGIKQAYQDGTANGNANMEVSQARGSYPTLAERLNEADDKQRQTDEQLAQKAQKDEVILKSEGVGLDNAKVDLLSAIQNKEGETSFNLLSIPRPKSVSPDKTTFLDVQKGKNLFNKATVTLDSQINSATGDIESASSSYAVSYFIAVEPSTKYTIRQVSNVTAFYDLNKNFISADTSKTSTFETPIDCYFIRLTVLSGHINTQQLELGEVFTSYESYIDPVTMLNEEVKIDNHLEKVTQNIESVRENIQQLENIIGENLNEVGNGDFSDSTLTGYNWNTGGSQYEINNGILKVTAPSTVAGIQVTHITPKLRPKIGDKIYISIEAKNVSANVSDAYFHLRDWAVGGTFNKWINLPTKKSDTFTKTSGIITVTKDFIDTARVYFRYSLTSVGENQTVEIKNMQAINLTDIFQSGNEPTLNEFESLNKYKTLRNGQMSQEVRLLSLEKTASDLVDVRTEKRTSKNQYVSKKRPIWTITYDDESKTIYDYAFPIHKAENAPFMFYIIPDHVEAGGSYNYGEATTWEELKEMEDWGAEIGHHAFNHRNTSYMDRKALVSNIEKANEIFERNGFAPKHFAHPGGANTINNSNVLQEYFDSAALTNNVISKYDMNPWRVGRRSSDAYPNIFAELDDLATNGGWLTTYNHAIHPDGYIDSPNNRCWTPAQLQERIQYAKSLGIEVVSWDEGLKTYAPFEYYFNDDIQPLYAVQRDGVVVNNPAQ